MKKKLLIFHPVVAPYRIDLFNYLSDYYDIKFCSFRDNLISQKFRYEDISKQLNYQPIILNKFYKILFFKIRKGLFSAIKNFNPDFVLVSECGYSSIAAIIYKRLFRKHYKIFSIIDDSYDMLTNNNQFSKKHEWAEKILVPYFDNIINVEPQATLYFQQKYKKGIYFPIIQDETRIHKLYEQALPISQQYIDQYQLHEKKILLFVGRLVALKNVDFVIQAFNKLNNPNVVFVIVGSGQKENNLKQNSYNNPNIIFTGRLEGEALYAWYNIAELFVLPSTQEAFGAVTNEALIGGCFALVSHKAGSNCLIKNGVNGYIFNPYKEKEFIELLQKSIKETPLRRYPLSIRKSKMQLPFSEYVKGLINQIEKS